MCVRCANGWRNAYISPYRLSQLIIRVCKPANEEEEKNVVIRLRRTPYGRHGRAESDKRNTERESQAHLGFIGFVRAFLRRIYTAKLASVVWWTLDTGRVVQSLGTFCFLFHVVRFEPEQLQIYGTYRRMWPACTRKNAKKKIIGIVANILRRICGRDE